MSSYPLDPLSLIWCGAALVIIGVCIGAAIVAMAWSAHSVRMQQAAAQRESDRRAARAAAETDLVREATKKLATESLA